MMDRTDRHCRYLLRLVAPRARLYTEMVTAAALRHGDAGRLLAFDAAEHPVALQLGGSDPAELAAAAKLGAAAGYDEINLNVGCPSDRVQAGCFGAALMREPALVAACVRAMADAQPLPVTVKTRLGVDHDDSYEFLCELVGAVADAGCGTVVVHARKAWLKGLSPKQNRDVPPLDYARVRRLKRDFPSLEIVLNGGLTTVEQTLAELDGVDGVMLGRAAYADPYVLGELDRALHGEELRDPLGVVTAYAAYCAREAAAGTPLRAMTRHLMGLFAGRPGGRRWRRAVGEPIPRGAAPHAVLDRLVELAAGIDGVSSQGLQVRHRVRHLNYNPSPGVY
ncbi:MAG: tRNA dihydrouridine(20/20a) synthase DusA [Gammaproteobacteria bacterium]|nr:tRNA dihydrouridine(20/20a) synthase DusA [Gammaproteobacteria bacterium]